MRHLRKISTIAILAVPAVIFVAGVGAAAAKPKRGAAPPRAELACFDKDGKVRLTSKTALRVGGDVTRPELLERVSPDPTQFRHAQVRVIIEALIDETGAVCASQLVGGEANELSRAYLEAVSSWKFRPAQRKGKAVAVSYTLVANFCPH
jgi:outer membrane biosynthesis protein TonB